MSRVARIILIAALIVTALSAAGYAAVVDAGTSASEVLAGNGSRAGYVLSHGSLVPNSEAVSIGSRHGVRNKDYIIDYASGALYFTEPLTQMDSAQVDYRYSGSGKASAGPSVTVPAMFSLGSALQLNAAYGLHAADAALGYTGQNILTYGLSSVSKFGGSLLSSMFYATSPQDTGGPAVQKANGWQNTGLRKDRLIVQNADLSFGKVKLNLGYEDVGKQFAGFGSLRDSNAAPADQLNKLEKERGIKRMDFSSQMPSGKNAGFGFTMNRISDLSGQITNNAFSYDGGKLKLNFASRNVDSHFTNFLGLTDKDAAHMALELGTKRTSYGLQLQTGLAAGNKPLWSGFSFDDIQSATGSLSYRSVDLDLPRVDIQADVRTMDPTFTQMTALNDAELTRMALIARRQFNPKAQTTDVTALDKAQLYQETGLNRSSASLAFDEGFMNFSLAHSSVDATKGGLNRDSFNVDGGRFSFYVNRQNIDHGFNRLASLQTVEQLQYGNEYGMATTEMGGKLKLGFGDLGISTAAVTDDSGAGVTRERFEFASPNKKLLLRARFQGMDPTFTRITDLANTGTSILNTDSYFYDPTNTTPVLDRTQTAYDMVFAPNQGRKVTAFQNDYTYISTNGSLSSYARQRYAFDNKFSPMNGIPMIGSLGILSGMTYNFISDSSTAQEGTAAPVITKVSQNHLGWADSSAKNTFDLYAINIDHGDGHPQTTDMLGFSKPVSKNFAFQGSFAAVSEDVQHSAADNATFGFQWNINKDVKLGLNMSNKSGAFTGSQQARQFSLSGPIAKRLLLFDNVTLGTDTGINTASLAGKQTTCNNAFKLSAGLLGGNLVVDNSDKLNPANGIYYSSHLFKYESDRSDKKWYHFSYNHQNLINPTGTPSVKRNYMLDMRLSAGTSLTFSSYSGKDGQTGVVVPVGGTVFKISHVLRKNAEGKDALNIYTDYTNDLNSTTLADAKIGGLGFTGLLTTKESFEVYYGRGILTQSGKAGDDNVFRIKFSRKTSQDHYLSLSAERKSGVDHTAIDPYQGSTVARIDFKMVFD